MSAATIANINVTQLNKVFAKDFVAQNLWAGYGASSAPLALAIKGASTINLQPSSTAAGLALSAASQKTTLASTDTVELTTASGQTVALRPAGKTQGVVFDTADAGGSTRTAINTLDDALRIKTKSATTGTLLDVVTDTAKVSYVHADASANEVVVDYRPAAGAFTSHAKLGLGTDTPATSLHVVGTSRSEGPLQVTAANPFELGQGVAGKETTAGQQVYSGTTVDIHGAAASGSAEQIFLHTKVATSGPMYVNKTGAFPSSFDSSLTVSGPVNILDGGSISMNGYSVVDTDGNASFKSVTVNGVSVVSAQNPYLLTAFDPSTLVSKDGAMGGLRLAGDSNYEVYSAEASVGAKSAAGAQSVASLDGRVGMQLRARVLNSSATGFVWENSSEVALLSLTADTGDLRVKNSLFLPTQIAIGQGSDLLTATPHAIAVKQPALDITTSNSSYGKLTLSTSTGDKTVLTASQATGQGVAAVTLDASAGILSTAQLVKVLDNDVWVNVDATTQRTLVFRDVAAGEDWKLAYDKSTSDPFLFLGKAGSSTAQVKAYSDTVLLGNLTRSQGTGILRVGGQAYFQNGAVTNSVTAEAGQVLSLGSDAGVRINGDLNVTGTLNAINQSMLESADKQIHMAVLEQYWEGTLSRDPAVSNEVVLDFYGMQYKNSAANVGDAYVKKAVNYRIDMSQASLAASDVTYIKTMEGVTLATSSGVPGTSGAQLDFLIAAASPLTQVQVVCGPDTFTLAVQAAEQEVDGTFNSEAGIVITGKPSASPTTDETTHAAKSLLWNYGTSGVLTENDDARAYWKLSGGDYVLERFVTSDAGATFEKIDYKFAISTDGGLSLYKTVNDGASSLVCKFSN